MAMADGARARRGGRAAAGSLGLRALVGGCLLVAVGVGMAAAKKADAGGDAGDYDYDYDSDGGDTPISKASTKYMEKTQCVIKHLDSLCVTSVEGEEGQPITKQCDVIDHGIISQSFCSGKALQDELETNGEEASNVLADLTTYGPDDLKAEFTVTTDPNIRTQNLHFTSAIVFASEPIMKPTVVTTLKDIKSAFTSEDHGEMSISFNCQKEGTSEVMVLVPATLDRPPEKKVAKKKKQNLEEMSTVVRFRIVKTCPPPQDDEGADTIVATPHGISVSMKTGGKLMTDAVSVVRDDVINQSFVPGAKQLYVIDASVSYVSFTLSVADSARRVRAMPPIVYTKDSAIWTPHASGTLTANTKRGHLIERGHPQRFDLALNCHKATDEGDPAIAVVRIPYQGGGGVSFEIAHTCEPIDGAESGNVGRSSIIEGFAIVTEDAKEVIVANGKPSPAYRRPDAARDTSHIMMGSRDGAAGTVIESSKWSPDEMRSHGYHVINANETSFDFKLMLSNRIAMVDAAPASISMKIPDVYVSPGMTALAYVEYTSLRIDHGEENHMSLKFVCKEEGMVQAVVLFQLTGKAQPKNPDDLKDEGVGAAEEAMFTVSKECAGRDAAALEKAGKFAADLGDAEAAKAAGHDGAASWGMRVEELSGLYVATNLHEAERGVGDIINAGEVAEPYRMASSTVRKVINADSNAVMQMVFFSKETQVVIGTPTAVAMRRAIAIPEMTGELANGGTLAPIAFDGNGDERTVRNTRNLLLSFHCIGAGTTPIMVHIPILAESGRRIVRIVVNKQCEGLHPKEGQPGSGVDVRRVDSVASAWHEDPLDDPVATDESLVDVVVDGVVDKDYHVARERRSGILDTEPLPETDLRRRIVVPTKVLATTFEIDAHPGKSIKFSAPQVVSFRPQVARATISGDAANGGVLNSKGKEVTAPLRFTLNYVCGARNGTAVLHVAIPLRPVGLVDFVIEKECYPVKGTATSIGNFVEGLFIGTAPGTSDVVQNGITQPKYRRWVDGAEDGTARLYLGPETRNITFYVRSDPPRKGATGEVLAGRPIASPVAVAHLPIANPNVVGDLRHGGVLTAIDTPMRVNFHCVYEGVTPITLYVPLRDPALWHVGRGTEADEKGTATRSHHAVVGLTIAKECGSVRGDAQGDALAAFSVNVDGVDLHGDGSSGLTHISARPDADYDPGGDGVASRAVNDGGLGGFGGDAPEGVVFDADAYDYDLLWHNEPYDYEWGTGAAGREHLALAGSHEEDFDFADDLAQSLDKQSDDFFNSIGGDGGGYYGDEIRGEPDDLSGLVDVASTEARLANPDVVVNGIPTGKYKLCEVEGEDDIDVGCPVNAVVAREVVSFLVAPPLDSAQGTVTLGEPFAHSLRHAVKARVENADVVVGRQLVPGEAAKVEVSFDCLAVGVSSPVVVTISYNKFKSASFRFTKVCGYSEAVAPGWSTFTLILVAAASMGLILVPWLGRRGYKRYVKLESDKE